MMDSEPRVQEMGHHKKEERREDKRDKKEERREDKRDDRDDDRHDHHDHHDHHHLAGHHQVALAGASSPRRVGSPRRG
jgi:hypothetical protein